MAIGKPNFSNLGHYASKSGIVQKKHTNISQDAGPKELSHYISDDVLNKTFTEYIGTESPVYKSLQDSDSGKPEGFHVQRYINKFKTCEILITTYHQEGDSWVGLKTPLDGFSINDGNWGNWRDYTDEFKVNNKVYLYPDEKNLSFSYELKYATTWEEVQKLKITSTINNAARDARLFANAPASGLVGVPLFMKAPAFQEVTPLQLPTSIRFNFSFGQSGLFSGEEEVFKPILALAAAFIPSYNKKDAMLTNLPAPTLEQQYYDIGQHLLGKDGNKSFMEEIKDQFPTQEQQREKNREWWDAFGWFSKTDEEKEKENSSDYGDSESDKYAKDILGTMVGAKIAERLSSIQSVIYQRMNAALAEQFNKVKTLNLRFGRVVLPPMVVHNVNWDFDLTQVDEYGYPSSGWIEFSGLETIKLATDEDLKVISEGGSNKTSLNMNTSKQNMSGNQR